ncbi:MAG: DUF2231 domain-containing protein [Campylobacterota bacterium]|nr:DUF2231 domain-containing protein [Campylobacterota bacterium]
MTLADLPPLPDLVIPPLPVEVPLLLHPAIVHFAIAIPVFVLILEIFNLIFKRRSLNIISSMLLIILIVIYVGLYITGKVDGSETYVLLSEAGQADFKVHKILGTYLVYFSVLLIVFKVMALLFRKKFFTLLYLIVLMIFIGLNLLQGKEGGELVYEHGANVEAVNIATDKLDDLQYDYDELKEEMDTLKTEMLTCKEVQESIDAVLAEGDVVEVDLKEEIIADANEKLEVVEAVQEEIVEDAVEKLEVVEALKAEVAAEAEASIKAIEAAEKNVTVESNTTATE